MLEDLRHLLGRDHPLDELNGALRDYVRSLDAPVVGAMHVTCADETEGECRESFQHSFVDALLPDLKFARKAPFRLCTLGGRYERGALAIAENHFATPESRRSFKVLLVKINAHVAVSGAAPRFGPMRRYDTDSDACGALHALLAGGRQPFSDDLREAFTGDGLDRLAALNDPQRVAAQYRSLLAAVTSARLQSRRVEQEIVRHQAASPTLYVVATCVTCNRADCDTELLCGVYLADHREGAPRDEYVGLGDDPGRYRVRCEAGRLHLHEDHPRA